MKCAHCHNKDADVFYYDHGIGVWICDHVCFEALLITREQAQKGPYFQVNHDSEGDYYER